MSIILIFFECAGSDPWLSGESKYTIGQWTQIDLGQDSSQYQIAGVLYRGSTASSISRINFVTDVSIQISDDGVNFITVPTRDDVKVYEGYHPIYNPSGGENTMYSQGYSIPNAVHVMYFYELRKTRFIRFVVTDKTDGQVQMRTGLLVHPNDGTAIPVPRGCPQRTCTFLASEPENFYNRGVLFRGLSFRSLVQQQGLTSLTENKNLNIGHTFKVKIPGLYVVFELNKNIATRF